MRSDVVDRRAQIGSGAGISATDYQFPTNPRQFDRPPAKGDLGVVAAFSVRGPSQRGIRPETVAADQPCRVSSARVALGVIENPGRQGGPVAVALCRDPAAKGLDTGGG